MEKLPKYEVQVINVPAATAADTQLELDEPYKPDTDYKFVIGMAVNISNPAADAGATSVLIGLRDSSKGVQHDDAPFELFNANGAVDPNKKYKEFLIPCDGRSLKPRVTVTVLSTQAYNVYFTFKLVDALVEVANV